MWTVDTALTLIRTLEPQVKKEAFCFLGLCGGVLRKGFSAKDLDIVVIPMNADEPADTRKAIDIIEKALGVSFGKLNSAEYNNQKYIPLQFYGAELPDKRRVELIVVK